MYNTRPIHPWKRWLPAVVLLMALAQLATAAHWHLGEHSSVECGLFSQQNHTDDAISAPSVFHPINTPAVQASFALSVYSPSHVSRSQSIRAPPAIA